MTGNSTTQYLQLYITKRCMETKITVITFFDQINYSWLDCENIQRSQKVKNKWQKNFLDKKSKCQTSCEYKKSKWFMSHDSNKRKR